MLANVALPLEISGTAAPMSSDRVTALLDLMQVRDFSKAYPHELSGGMQQRVNIARSLVHDPRVLLMDEPFGSLDEVTRENLNLALLRIHRLKRPTVVFVTHSLREAAFLADRVIVLTHRPATVKAIITTTLPQQRGDGIQMEAPFIELLAEIRERFFESEGAGD